MISGATEESARTRHLLGGLVLAAATSFKPNAILIVAPIIASGLLLPPRNIRRRVFFSGILVEGMVVGIWWLALVAVFWFQDTLRAFFNAVFLFNAGYGGDVWQNLKASLEPQNILVIRYPFLLPLLFLFLCGLLYGIGRGRHRRWAHLAAWFIGAYLGASVLGRFYPAYLTDFLLRPRRRPPLRRFSRRRRLRRAYSTPRQRLGRNATLTDVSAVSPRKSVRNAGESPLAKSHRWRQVGQPNLRTAASIPAAAPARSSAVIAGWTVIVAPNARNHGSAKRGRSDGWSKFTNSTADL